MKVSSTFRAKARRRYFHIFQVEAYLTYCEDIVSKGISINCKQNFDVLNKGGPLSGCSSSNIF